MPDISIDILDNILIKATKSKEHARDFRDSDYPTKKETNPNRKLKQKWQSKMEKKPTTELDKISTEYMELANEVI